MVGRTISHYRIIEKLGEGGMGVVYKAIDTRLDRAVALKFLRADRLGDADRRRRFVQEAKAASALNHPNITAVYDVETDTDDSFLVMEFLAGRTLQQRIGKRGLPLADAVQYMTQVADALSAAHAAGIVHRDLKPSNIMVGDSGVVKLLDFGLAKLREPAASIANAATVTADIGLTGLGVAIGTASYMSPEQARGETVDQRTDVWAFGCVLYEVLSGRMAFGTDSPSATIARVLESEPDWTALPASTPQSLQRVVRSCLRKDLRHRLRHIDPTQLDVLDERPEGMRMPWLWPAAIAAALLIGLGVGWLVSRRSIAVITPSSAVVRLSTPFATTVQVGDWNQPLLAVAPDGSSLVYVSRPAAEVQGRLLLRRVDRTEAVPLSGTEGAANPFYSPDASSVGFFADGRLKTVSLADGEVRTLVPGAGLGGTWSRDNTIVFSGTGFIDGLMRVSASGGTPEALTRLADGEALHRWPSLSPDGKVIVYTTSNTIGPGLESPRIVAEALDTKKRAILPVDATYATFAPGGRYLLLVRAGTVLAAGFDTGSLSLTGSPVPLVDGVMQSSSGAAHFGVSTSAFAYLPGTAETRRLVWVDRQGKAETIADAPPRLYVHPRLSPDGTKIAVMIPEPKNDIWVYDPLRGALTRLTFEGSNAYPIWTRDGTRVTYVSTREGHPPNLFWKSADGSGPEERLVTSENTQVAETWGPDGTLVFVELRPPAQTGWDILTLSIDGSRQPKEFLATRFNDTTPQISPTGRYVAHGSNEGSAGEVFVHSFPDPSTKLQVSVGGGAQSAWRGDERELYYRSAGAMMAVDITTEPKLSAGKPRMLFRDQYAQIQGKNYDVTLDGQRFLMVRTNEQIAPRDITVVLNWMHDLEARLAASR